MELAWRHLNLVLGWLWHEWQNNYHRFSTAIFQTAGLNAPLAAILVMPPAI